MHRYFSRISWAFAVYIAANGYYFRSSSIEVTYTFEFLGEHACTAYETINRGKSHRPESQERHGYVQGEPLNMPGLNGGITL